MNLKWGDKIKINSIVVAGKVKVSHKFELAAPSLKVSIK